MKLDLVATILKIGLSGLVFLLALLSYNLLAREQRADAPRPAILRATRNYSLLCVLMAVIVGGFAVGEQLLRKTDEDTILNCKNSLERLRTDSGDAETVEHLRAAIRELDSSCSTLIQELR